MLKGVGAAAVGRSEAGPAGAGRTDREATGRAGTGRSRRAGGGVVGRTGGSWATASGGCRSGVCPTWVGPAGVAGRVGAVMAVRVVTNGRGAGQSREGRTDAGRASLAGGGRAGTGRPERQG